MPVFEILLFLGSFILILFAGIYIFLIFYNRRSKKDIGKFLSQTSEFKPTLFHNIKLRYWTTNGTRTMISPNNKCEIYLFDNFFAIVRRQNFIFKAFFVPVLITSDITSAKNIFNYLTVYKPERVIFNEVIKGQIDIKLRDPIYKHYTIEITFKELTNEQLERLETIKNW